MTAKGICKVIPGPDCMYVLNLNTRQVGRTENKVEKKYILTMLTTTRRQPLSLAAERQRKPLEVRSVILNSHAPITRNHSTVAGSTKSHRYFKRLPKLRIN